jgi:hypothetical protein
LETTRGVPAWKPHGQSYAEVLLHGQAKAARSEQYYECWSNRGYYRDGWLARSLQKRGEPIDMDNWTLHNVAEDFSESADLRSQHPERLRELVDAFDQAAWTNLVYPLDNRTMMQRLGDAATRGQPPGPRRFPAGSQTVHRGIVVPLISDRSFRVTARITHRDGDEGILWSLGEMIAGAVMYVEQGMLRVTYNGFGRFTELAPVALAPGERDVCLEYEALGARRGRGRVLIDGAAASGWAELTPTLMGGFHEGLDIGLDRRCPVDWRLYEKHGVFRYAGVIAEVTIDPGEHAPDSALRPKAAQP